MQFVKNLMSRQRGRRFARSNAILSEAYLVVGILYGGRLGKGSGINSREKLMSFHRRGWIATPHARYWQAHARRKKYFSIKKYHQCARSYIWYLLNMIWHILQHKKIMFCNLYCLLNLQYVILFKVRTLGSSLKNALKKIYFCEDVI